MKHTFYLAPLKGYTDHIFRNVHAARFNSLDIAVAPFITTHNGKIKTSHILGLLPEKNTGMPVIPQILGKSPEDFISLASRLHDLGYSTLNWNLGCPFPQVARKLRGSGLLPHPDIIDAFLDRVTNAIPNRLSVKTRLGRYRYDEIFKLIQVFNRYPLAEIIVHPRTGVQMYNGRPDLETFETLLDMTSHRIVYNGDILSPKDLEALKTRFPTVNGWMVGRAVLANPFLPGLLKDPSSGPAEPVETFRRFHDELYQCYRCSLSGPSHLLDRMKGLWKYFHVPFADGESIRKKIHKTQKIEVYESSVKRFFETEAQWTGKVKTEPMQRACR